MRSVAAGDLLSEVTGAEIGGGGGTLAWVGFLPHPMGENAANASIKKPRPARTFRENLSLRSMLDSVWPWDINNSFGISIHSTKQINYPGWEGMGQSGGILLAIENQAERCAALVTGCLDTITGCLDTFFSEFS